jgi:hypothetical protein
MTRNSYSYGDQDPDESRDRVADRLREAASRRRQLPESAWETTPHLLYRPLEVASPEDYHQSLVPQALGRVSGRRAIVFQAGKTGLQLNPSVIAPRNANAHKRMAGRLYVENRLASHEPGIAGRTVQAPVTADIVDSYQGRVGDNTRVGLKLSDPSGTVAAERATVLRYYCSQVPQAADRLAIIEPLIVPVAIIEGTERLRPAELDHYMETMAAGLGRTTLGPVVYTPNLPF